MSGTADASPQFRTGIGRSSADTIQLLGHDLAGELIGQVGFGELAFWLIARRRPTPAQRAMFEAVLVSLADHGFTPTAIAARLTYTSAPESLQGAVAAGLLGGGSRFLGVTEDTARFLSECLARHTERPDDDDDVGWEEIAIEEVAAHDTGGHRIPGLGHPVHKVEDPRTPVLLDLARRHGTFGEHLLLLAAIGRIHGVILGRDLPLNGAGVCGAVLADLGLPLGVIRGCSLLARCAGLLGHLVEEQTDPVGMDIYLGVDRNVDYQPPA